MKKMKVYILTYKRNKVLNQTLKNVFNSSFKDIPNTEVTIINNHSNFKLNKEFEGKVKVLHNMVRPDWSTCDMSPNWNQALMDGFKDLNNPDSEIVVTLQNDTILHNDWAKNLLKLHKKYNFIVGHYGDNVVSYTADAVKRIGMWDERFVVIHKEADYFLRALIFNKDKSCINDQQAKRLLNHKDALPLDISNKNRDKEYWDIRKKSRTSPIYDMVLKVFQHKWNGTWKSQPEVDGWIINWADDFINNPPNMKKSKAKSYVRYPYFELDVETLKEQNFIL